MATYPPEEQRRFWNNWNAAAHEGRPLDAASEARRSFVVDGIGRLDLLPDQCRILEVGCGSGWLTTELVRHGQVTAVDLADEVLERARTRVPAADFRAGDVLTMPLDAGAFDLIVTLETLSHVGDQAEFFRRMRELLVPGGTLLLTTQNRRVMERTETMGGQPGFSRHWLLPGDVRRLALPHFQIRTLSTLLPVYGTGILRAAHSRWLTSPLGILIGKGGVRRIQERLGLGQTIVFAGRARP